MDVAISSLPSSLFSSEGRTATRADVLGLNEVVCFSSRIVCGEGCIRLGCSVGVARVTGPIRAFSIFSSSYVCVVVMYVLVYIFFYVDVRTYVDFPLVMYVFMCLYLCFLCRCTYVC